MTYTVNNSIGDIVAVVNDYQKEIVAGLELAGYGYMNYGELTAENFVKVAENFAGRTPPLDPQRGQIWYDISQANPVLRSFNGSTWNPLFSIDLANNRALIYYNGAPIAPDLNPVPTTLVVRGTDGKIPASSLPTVGSVDHASTADLATNATHADSATKLDNSRTFGSRNNGLPFNGTQDVPLTTSHIAEGDQTYFTQTRARGAFSGGRYITVNATTGEISFNGPDPTSGGDGAVGPQGPKGDKGDKGDTGDTGPQGPQGIPGNDGAPAIVANGTNWVQMANGFKIQWGTLFIAGNARGTFVFPVAFTSKPVLTVDGLTGNSMDAKDNYVTANLSSTTATTGAWHNAADDSGTVNWIAVGF